MRLFEIEANWLRDCAYQDFLLYCKLWNEVAHIYKDSDEEWDCPQAQLAYKRAMNLEAVANFIDPQGRSSVYLRYRDEKISFTTTH